jgi:hypothetical protein
MALTGSKESVLTYVSETYLGNEHLLLHEFEILHTGLFYTTIGFFISSAVIISRLNQQFREAKILKELYKVLYTETFSSFGFTSTTLCRFTALIFENFCSGITNDAMITSATRSLSLTTKRSSHRVAAKRQPSPFQNGAGTSLRRSSSFPRMMVTR